MLLATTMDNDVDHPFLYACVLGIYHPNVTFAGDDIQNYQARQFEFLRVHWYRYQGQNVQWRDLKLDVLSFPPVTSDGAFGYVDPGNVLRACHITRVLPVPLSRRDNVLVLCKKLSKFYEPPLK